MTTEVLSQAHDNHRYIVHTDGACRNNPGPGGWGVVLQLEAEGSIIKEKDLSDATVKETTNNRMELSAVLGGLKRLKDKTIPITVRSDSKYVIDGMSNWLEGWKRNGWRTSNKKPVLNMDLWQELDQLCETLGPITWTWVKGHSGDPMNERCDRLAKLAIDKAVRKHRSLQ